MNEQQEKKILPCPFCGGNAVLTNSIMGDPRMVRCENCPASFSEMDFADGKCNPLEKMLEAWNTRQAAYTPRPDVEVVARGIATKIAVRLHGVDFCTLKFVEDNWKNYIEHATAAIDAIFNKSGE